MQDIIISRRSIIAASKSMSVTAAILGSILALLSVIMAANAGETAGTFVQHALLALPPVETVLVHFGGVHV